MQFRRVVVLVLLFLPLDLFAQQNKWFEVRTPHFALFTDTSEAKGRRLLTDLEGRVSAFASAFGSLPERQSPIHVFLFNRAEDFIDAAPLGLGARIDKSAYLQRGPDRVFIIARDKSPEDIAEDVGRALGHVLFERYVFWRPFWLAEAAGEYFRKIGRDPDDKTISAEDGFSVADVVTIVPSSTYQDNEPGGVFRALSYRLFRIIQEESPEEIARFMGVLRSEEGNRARPQLGPNVNDARLQSYVETRLTAVTSSVAVQAAPLAEAQLALLRGDLLLAIGKPAEAGRWYNADSVDARSARAIVNRFSRPGIEAVRSLDRASREQPDNGLVQFHFGSLEIETPKDVELQVQALERAVALLPLLGRAHAELARVYALSGAAEKGLAPIEKAIELEPEFADRFFEIRAEMLLGSRRLDDAYKSMQTAAALPHKDRPTAELYERKVSALARRIADVRREGDLQRAEALRTQVEERARALDPPKPPPPAPQPVRDGRITFEIEARARVEVVSQVFPEYPQALIQKGTAGAIALNVTVSADGSVRSASVASSQIPELNAAAIEAAKLWTFEPLVFSGRGSTASLRLIFQFIVQ